MRSSHTGARLDSKLSPLGITSESPLKDSSHAIRLPSRIEAIDERASKLRSSLKESSSSKKRPHSKGKLKPLTVSSSLPIGQYYYSVYNGNNGNLIREMLEKRGIWTEISNDEACLKAQFIWKPTGFNPKVSFKINRQQYDRIDKSAKITMPKVVNHVENLWGITTKTGLIRSLKRYYKQTPTASKSLNGLTLLCSVENLYSCFDSTPTSFLVQSSIDSYDFHQFIARFHQISRGDSYMCKERTPTKHCENNIWIVKPASMNQGKGIEIFRSLRDITKFLTSRPAYTYWVIQKYIEKPLLYKQRKFDIRIWALLTAKGELFLYQEGYFRTTSQEYTVDAQDNYIHLTNNCLQKFGEDYGKFEDGNIVSFADFQSYLDEQFPDLKPSIQNHIIPRIKDLIIDTIQSIRCNINPNKRRNCFELFGYDFMIDEDFRTWLIEVNSNPYIGIPNSYTGTLIRNMLDDMFDIVLDNVYKPKTDMREERENRFELILDQFKGINQRRDFSVDIYPFEEMKQVVGRFKKLQEKKKMNIINGSASKDKKQLTVKFPQALTTQNHQFFKQALVKSKDDSHQKPSPYTGTISELINSRQTNQRLSQSLKPVNKVKKRFKLKEGESLNVVNMSIKPKTLNEIKTIQEEHDDTVPLLQEKLQSQTVIPSPQSKFLNQTFNHSKQQGKTFFIKTQNNGGFLPQLTLVQQAQRLCKQIKTIDRLNQSGGWLSSMCDKKDFNNLFNKILYKFNQWQIFDIEKLNDASKSLEQMVSSRNIYYFTEDFPMQQLLSILLNKEEIPLEIKESVMFSFETISKSPALKKSICLFNELVQFLLKFVQETCDQSEYNSAYDKLYFMAINILINISYIQPQKCYIPGETIERERLRQASIDNGIFQVLYKLKDQGQFLSEDAQNFIKNNFFDVVNTDRNNLKVFQTIDQDKLKDVPLELPSIFGGAKKSLKPPLAPSSLAQSPTVIATPGQLDFQQN